MPGIMPGMPYAKKLPPEGAELQVCKVCGKLHGRVPNRAGANPTMRATCTAHRRGSGRTEPCMQFPRPGFLVCDNHGGSIPVAQRAAEDRLAHQRVVAAAARHAVPVDRPPAEGLRFLLASVAGEVEWLRIQVHELDPTGMWRGTRGVQRIEKVGFQAGTTTTTDVGPMVTVVWDEYTKAQDRYAKLCIEAIKLGLTWEQIKLDQQFGARIAAGFTYLFARIKPHLAGVEEEVHDQFASVLLLLAGGGELPAIEA